MKVLGFDGITRTLSLIEKKRGNVSSYHERARKLLSKLFPFHKVFEDVYLMGSMTESNKTLIADFLIPSLSLVIEVHGEQHFTINSHFYSNKLDFIRAQKRDKIKKEWCELNNLKMIELLYSDKDEIWEKLLI